MKKICDVTSTIFNDHIIISFEKDWLQIFDKLPKFSAIIDNKCRLVLIGPQISFDKLTMKKDGHEKL